MNSQWRMCLFLAVLASSATPTRSLAESKSNLTPQQIYAKWARSVVTIETPGKSGTGFFDSQGRLFTAYHVVQGARKITIVFSDGFRVAAVGARAFNQVLDIAILVTNTYKGKNTRETGPPLGDWSSSKVGDKLAVIGSPLGLSGTLTEGLLSAKRAIRNGASYLQLSASISPGSSGSPVIDSRGLVLGMAVSSLTDGQNLNLAVSAKDLKALDVKAPKVAGRKQVVPENKQADVARITEPFRSFDCHSQVRKLTYCRDGSTIACMTTDHQIMLFDVNTGILRQSIDVGKGKPSFTISANGSRIARLCFDDAYPRHESVGIWDVPSGELVKTINGDGSRIGSCALSSDGSQLAVVSQRADRLRSTIDLWDVSRGILIRTIDTQVGEVTDCVLASGDTTIVGQVFDGIRVWDVQSGELRTSFETAPSVPFVISPDGSTIALRANIDSDSVSLWDLRSGHLKNTLKCISSILRDAMSFSPDGLSFASASTTPTSSQIQLWDVRTGKVKESLGGREGILTLTFSPDGHALATGGGFTRKINFWHLDPKDNKH